ncbi:MAG: hypothetical protein PVH73_07085 [Candidatus Bathyarchaeota archaeon]
MKQKIKLKYEHKRYVTWLEMKQKPVSLSFGLVFLLSARVVTAAAQERTVGVTEGDWFTYDVNASWNSTDPNAPFPPSAYGDWEIMNGTEWTKITITDVSGTNVSFQGLSHFKNGTEELGGGYIDVDTGDEANATFVLISANLDVNDNLYTSGNYSSWAINETITRAYPDGVRNTNHVNMTYGGSWTVNETECHYYYYINFYWDKETGILVEDSFAVSNQTEEHLTTWSVVSTIVDSSVWIIPEFPAGTSMLVISIILVVTIFGIERRLTKKQPANNN